MFVVDTNILVYAAVRSLPQHRRARRVVQEWMRQPSPWFVTWGILYEFMRVTTHPGVFSRPWTWAGAEAFVGTLLSAGGVEALTPTHRHREVLRQVVEECPEVAGNVVHDAHTAVLMREHGIREIRTLDSHFTRFPFLTVVNPLA